MSEHLTVDRTDAGMELTLNRPKARNALSRALILDLTQALADGAQDKGVRSVILTGAPPAFSAGLDLHEVAEATPEQAEHDASRLRALFETLDNFPKPVIAAVNGPAVAGGAGLASVCDVVLMAESAVIGYPEIKRGLIPALVMCYLRRLVSERHAKYLIMTGESISAYRAVELGLATEAIASDELLSRARDYARKFANYAEQPLAAAKNLWNRIRELPHEEAVATARDLNAQMRTTGESQAGVAAFFKK